MSFYWCSPPPHFAGQDEDYAMMYKAFQRDRSLELEEHVGGHEFEFKKQRGNLASESSH